jgi:hypothetical protein
MSPVRRLHVHPALFALALLTAAAGIASARTTPESVQRLILDPGLARRTARMNAQPASAQAANVFNVGLPAGAVQLDSVWYDLQDMGSLGHRIEVGSDGRVHVAWQDEFCELGGGCPPNLNAPQPYPNRDMGYAVRDAAGHWTNQGRVFDSSVPNCTGSRDVIGGFGGVTLAPSGRVAVSQHLNYDGTGLRGHFALQDANGGSTFSEYLSPPTGTDYLFPQVAASTNGSFTLLGEQADGGRYQGCVDFNIAYLPAPGTKYTCFNWQLSSWTSVMPLSTFRVRPGFPCMAAGSDGRVGIAVTDFGGNVYLAESNDGSFHAGTVRIRNLTNYTDASITQTDSTSAQYRPYLHCHVAYADTTPNVVWSELQARKSGTTFNYVDYHSRIRHWSSKTGVRTVYQVPAGVADRYDDLDLGLNGPMAGFNTISVDWPQVGFSVDGSETYIAWLRYTDAQIDPTADAGLPGIITGCGYGDIASSVSFNGGGFSAPQNLTNTPNTDERFFSLATRNPGSRAHILFQAPATNQAGVTVIGDRGATNQNILRRIAYLEVPFNASVLDAPAPGVAVHQPLRVSPNPAFATSHVRFSVSPWPMNRTLDVCDILGRRVSTIALAPGASSVEWSGRDAGGRMSPAGVYLVHVREEPADPAVRFVLAR